MGLHPHVAGDRHEVLYFQGATPAAEVVVERQRLNQGVRRRNTRACDVLDVRFGNSFAKTQIHGAAPSASPVAGQGLPDHMVQNGRRILSIGANLLYEKYGRGT